MEDERIPGVSRQELKRLKAMPLPDFRRWLQRVINHIKLGRKAAKNG